MIVGGLGKNLMAYRMGCQMKSYSWHYFFCLTSCGPSSLLFKQKIFTMNLHAADVLKKLKDIKKLQKVKQPIGVDTLLLYFNVTPEVLDSLLKELQQEGRVMLTDGRYYQNNKRLAHPKVDLVENAS